MTTIFKDQAVQDEFEMKGYVTVPLLSEQQVTRLMEVYKHHIDPHWITGLYESSRNHNFEINRQINGAIFKEMQSASQRLFQGHKLYGGTFMVKAAQNSEMLPLHQDWSVVEEDQYQNLFIWCPLMDVSRVNGGLFLLEGSHKYFHSLRSGSYPSNRYLIPPELHNFITDISLKTGEAIIYSDQLFHGSYANCSMKDRVVVTGRVMQEEADLVYFHKANDNEVDVYKASPEFYLTHIDSIAKGQMPKNTSKLYSRPYNHKPVTDQSLRDKISENFQKLNFKTMKNGQLFRNKDLQSAFDKDGYVVIDLIGKEEVQELRTFYESLENAPIPEYGFQVSLDNQNPDYVRNVAKKLMNTVKEGVDKYFKNYKIFTASFVIKEPNPLGVVPPHQDWTFVDEQKYWSATIWCPLVDVDMSNGGLGIIKGSHRFYDHVRPSPSPQYKPPFSDQLMDIFPYLKIINLKVGQALVFNNQTLHASPPNTTDTLRLAFGIGITHEDAAIRHYYILPGKQKAVIEGFEVPEDFFYQYNNTRLTAMYEKNEKPDGLTSIGVFANEYQHYETRELIEKIESTQNQKDFELIAKMADLFGYNADSTKKEENMARNESGDSQGIPFWKIYTPMNIYREIKYRMTSR